MFKELNGLCLKDASGTLFATLDDGHQLRIGLLHGRIVHIGSLALRGVGALNSLISRCALSLRFDSDTLMTPQPDLPCTPAILALLADD